MDEIAKGFATLHVYIAQEDNIFSLIPAVVVFRRLARSAFFSFTSLIVVSHE